ncbi:hypothetical protein GCM10007096_18350 [Pullulanibacillus pueri]|uniref:Uncharacterized protein n=1 Tax=Pullulanibacillus pueri TaxID=1437324 RepID=A0A8J3EMK9_9BACL|nr:hypothetical protein GCM10007096_18350 [Pullulanibacillus pueri]
MNTPSFPLLLKGPPLRSKSVSVKGVKGGVSVECWRQKLLCPKWINVKKYKVAKGEGYYTQ